MSETLLNPSRDDFMALLEESFGARGGLTEGKVISATIVSIENDFVLVDIGLKTEGRIPEREFGAEAATLKAGDTVEV